MQQPNTLNWDTSLLPAQNEVAVRAAIRFKADTNLVFLTSVTRGLEIVPREELLSDTEHHGIEIIYPGPALMVRYRTEGDR